MLDQEENSNKGHFNCVLLNKIVVSMLTFLGEESCPHLTLKVHLKKKKHIVKYFSK